MKNAGIGSMIRYRFVCDVLNSVMRQTKISTGVVIEESEGRPVEVLDAETGSVHRVLEVIEVLACNNENFN